jgi:hypothetical protein
MEGHECHVTILLNFQNRDLATKFIVHLKTGNFKCVIRRSGSKGVVFTMSCGSRVCSAIATYTAKYHKYYPPLTPFSRNKLYVDVLACCDHNSFFKLIVGSDSSNDFIFWY